MNSFKNIIEYIMKTRSKFLRIVVPIIALSLYFFLLSFNNVYTETYDIEPLTTARETIRSPITIENQQETKRKTREVYQSVQDRFDISTEIAQEQIGYIAEIFNAVEKLEAESMKEDDSDAPVPLNNREKVERLKQLISNSITEKVDDSVFLRLIDVSPEEREQGEELFITYVQEVYETGVRTANMNSAIESIKENIRYSTLDDNLIEALQELTEFVIVENSFYDADKTEEARKQAASTVEPVMINAGEVIVREGETITNEVYEKLQLVGLLNEDRNVFPVIGLAILILLIGSIIFYEMNRIDNYKRLDKGAIASILLISFFVVSLMKTISLFTTHANELFFIVPVATGVLLVKQLINERLAIVLTALYAILGGIIFNGQIPGTLNIEAVVYFFFSQFAAIVCLMNVKDRLSIVRSGIGMSIANIVTILLFVFLSFEKYSLADLLLLSGYGLASAFLSAVLTIGLLPFFETGLGILSDIKLLQLSSPNQPLLKKILTEAPGTYHHSIMVANLSETACDAIGANGLLARVAAYYHDIGKTVRPHYFIENQLSIKNPHDMISPEQSAEIIIRHPYDGAELLKKHRMPKEIIDVAMQHHGTTLLKYFYFKEKEQNPTTREADFRYPGPKPQTKEAAVISICDSVEAAVRSLQEPTEEKIEEIVSNIVNERLMDGQLDECPLTIKEVKIVHQTICETLKGIFHSRIQYPSKEAK
ncbi:HD family phosphohydrolase [Ornithinibacillus sp. BX22]|uniref:HD family phosphohydrolase n=2 Tax=Ornithinibacillus TaxID=484508 RepID=A0A923L6A6_9BACI|nr:MULTISPECIES: HD family phosphohydrolase [Ornithinibacillus]MBC5637244.1 HD family phosphohydrolase [Ornithinibacillus hominis]MBS3679546.1 HD family phosphohydrolase [Ornithinibacillus massiliensis]